MVLTYESSVTLLAGPWGCSPCLLLGQSPECGLKSLGRPLRGGAYATCAVCFRVPWGLTTTEKAQRTGSGLWDPGSCCMSLAAFHCSVGACGCGFCWNPILGWFKGTPNKKPFMLGVPLKRHPFAVSSCLPICLSFGPPCCGSLELERPFNQLDTFETIGRRLFGEDIRGAPRATQVSHNSQGRTQFHILVGKQHILSIAHVISLWAMF